MGDVEVTRASCPVLRFCNVPRGDYFLVFSCTVEVMSTTARNNSNTPYRWIKAFVEDGLEHIKGRRYSSHIFSQAFPNNLELTITYTLG